MNASQILSSTGNVLCFERAFSYPATSKLVWASHHRVSTKIPVTGFDRQAFRLFNVIMFSLIWLERDTNAVSQHNDMPPTELPWAVKSHSVTMRRNETKFSSFVALWRKERQQLYFQENLHCRRWDQEFDLCRWTCWKFYQARKQCKP